MQSSDQDRLQFLVKENNRFRELLIQSCATGRPIAQVKFFGQLVFYCTDNSHPQINNANTNNTNTLKLHSAINNGDSSQQQALISSINYRC